MADERRVVISLIVVSLIAPRVDSVSSIPRKRLSLTERVETMRKVQQDDGLHRYIDTRFIQPTSNICERFSSCAGYSVGDNRRSLIPEHFGSQMFLHCNMDKWGVLDVNKAHNE